MHTNNFINNNNDEKLIDDAADQLTDSDQLDDNYANTIGKGYGDSSW